MRLLQLSGHTDLQLITHDADKLPPYAILSHTWGADNEEVTFDDIVEGAGRDKPGYAKILFCGQQALRDGLKHFWVDTCCIDKRNHSELSEAIISMFRWYQKATKCYVYLSDVSKVKHDRDGGPGDWEDAFRKSRWFTRGWTLQELLAPNEVEFWSRDGHLLGTKDSLKDLISEVTSIPTQALFGAPLSGFSTLERQRWAKKRETKKIEDRAYCLMGMFDVSIPVLYGEGGENALRRLLDGVTKSQAPPDQTAAFTQDGATPEKTRQARREEVLASLKFDQMDHCHQTIKDAQRRTCEWLLQHPDYIAWQNKDEESSNHRILCIAGKPGAGKSTLMKFVLAHVRKNGKPHEIVLDFFFNARGDSFEKTTLGMYRALIFQLLHQAPDLQRVLDDIGEDGGHGPFAPEWTPSKLKDPELQCVLEDIRDDTSYESSVSVSTWTLSRLQDIFRDALSNLGPRKLIIFVDALDECNENEVRDMVAFLEDLGKHHLRNESRLSMCFASRHYPSIKVEHRWRLILEDEAGHTEDLREYIDRRLQTGKKNKNFDEIRAVLQEKANGVFMWVVLVVVILNDEFRRGHIWAVKKKLLETPTELSDLFKELLQRDRVNMDNLLLCLQWLLFAKRPLSREEFYFAMESGLHEDGSQWRPQPWDPEHITVGDMDRLILNSSKGLAELTKSKKAPTVQFIHESIRHFLLEDGGLQQLWPELAGDVAILSHKRLQESCSNYVAADLSSYTDTSKALPKASSAELKDLRKRVTGVFPLLDYACEGVLYHANEASRVDTQEAVLPSSTLKTWVYVHNFLTPSYTRRYSDRVSLLHVLADNNFAQLIRSTNAVQMLNTMNMDIDAQGGPLGNALQVASRNGNEEVVHILLYAGANVNAQGGEAGNALYAASVANHGRVVQMLIDAGANVNAQGGNFGNALQAACCEPGNKEVVRMLIETGADVNAQGGHYGNALQAACCEPGNKEVVRMLIETGADVNAQGGHYSNALQAASIRGNEEGVQMLIDAGADINAQGGQYENALQAASIRGNEEVVQMLIDAGADVNAQGGQYDNALQAASMRGNEEGVQMLIDAGADINAQGSGEYSTALCAASYGGWWRAAQLLLEGGANVNIQSGRYGTPLQAACLAGHSKLLRLLLEWHADVEVTAETGETPLQAACVAGATDIVKVLLEHNANTNAPPGSHGTALRAAALQGSEEIVSQLLIHGADPVPDVTQSGDALFVASSGGFLNIVKELLAFGANPNTSHLQKSALQAAEEGCHYEVVDVLVNAGAMVPKETQPVTKEPDTGMPTIGQHLERRRPSFDDGDNSDVETMTESIFSRQEFDSTSRPSATTSISRNSKRKTRGVPSIPFQPSAYASSSASRMYTGQSTDRGFVDKLLNTQSVSENPHLTMAGATPTSEDDLSEGPHSIVPREQSPTPSTLDHALAIGDVDQVSLLLDRHLDTIANGSWEWLPELFELGFDAPRIAKLLFEQQTQTPLIHFEPWAFKGRQPRIDGHLQRCVHGGGELPKSEDSHFDLRATVASLCGIAGIVPLAEKEATWNGQVEFDDNFGASVSFYVGQRDPNNTSTFLSRIIDALDGFCSAAAEFQSHGGCCDRYTYLCSCNSPECETSDTVRLAVMPFRLSVGLQESLRQAHENMNDESSLGPCASYARDILSEVLPDLVGEQSNTGSLTTDLHYCALAVQFLCLTFISYCQAHVGAMHFFFLEDAVRSARLAGALEESVAESYPTVHFELQRLTCLDAMLKDRVIVFRPGLSSNGGTRQEKNQRYDVVAALEDVVDTWGPAGLILSGDNARAKMVSGVFIRGGVIQRANELWHWSPEVGKEQLDACIESLITPVRIGALVTINPHCNPDEMQCLSNADGFRDHLGSYDQFWTEKQRQVGFSAGQYINVQFIDVFEKDPGRTLKMEVRESLYRILNHTSTDQLLPLLESSWGLQVSFCSGIARRVEMRELFADILPMWMQRKTPCPKQWKTLRDTYQVIQILRKGDLNSWVSQIFEHGGDCYRLFCEAVVDIIHELVPTGVDKSGDHFVVAWITAQKDMCTQCLRFPIKNGNYWTRVLQDSRDCATFAYLTMDCLQFRGQGCHMFQPFQIRLAETEVHRHFDIPGSQVAIKPHSQWTLQHQQVYAIGKFQSDGTLQMRARVSKPTPAADTELIVKPRHIPDRIWLRVLRQRYEPGRLRERSTPLDRVHKVIIASTEQS